MVPRGYMIPGWPPDIQLFRVVQTQRMPIFMGRSGGIVEEIVQFEIACITPNAVNTGYMDRGNFFYAEIIISRIGIKPDRFRCQIFFEISPYPELYLMGYIF